MLKLITILLGCSLTLAGSVRAEKADKTDPNKKKQASKSKTVQKQQVAPRQFKAPNTHVQKMQPEHVNKPVPNTAKTNVPKKHELRRMVLPETNRPANIQSAKVQNNQQLQATNQQQLQTNPTQQFQKNRLPRPTIEKIRAQHRNFHAQPNTSIASAQFNQNFQITEAQNWRGSHYNAFRSYRPQWHDQGWWRSHHSRVELIGGGWYYWDGGYWYPAWGYDQSAAYYPYDGPIYSGPRARPLDQVIADVQSALQEQGYYRGEVDGLMGPLTREALATYQNAQGLQPTAAIDEPTLDSLGLT